MEKIICLLILMLSVASYNISAQNISFSYDNDGNMESRYEVTLKSSAPKNTEEKETPAEIISVELAEQKITVHPNPTKGEICVEITPLNPEEENFIRIFDSLGRLLETKKIEPERTYLKISGNPGVYLLNIHLGENVSKWKIIKQ